MLSRVADSLYWMSRYLERAEHTARLIDVNLNLMLDQSETTSDRRWQRVLACLATGAPEEVQDGTAITRLVTFDLDYPGSIVYSIMNARENARQVREQISSEMWEQLNRLFHQVRRVGVEDLWDAQPMEFLAGVKEGAYLFQGITDSTMNHSEGWQFIQAGRAIERACQTATLVDVHFLEFLGSAEWAAEAGDYVEWIGLLKCCTAFEAYCKVYSADLSPNSIAEFLVLNGAFPHSVRFAADRLQKALEVVKEESSTRKADRVERLSGRLKASLGFGQIDEIMAGGLHGYLDNVRRQCAQIHLAMTQVYITYPIESALEV